MPLAFLQGTNPLYLLNWYWKWLGYEKKMKDALKVLKKMSSDVVQKRIAARKKEGGDESRPDFLDILLNAHQDGAMDLEEIQWQVDTFLFAGFDTTSQGIAWTLWCLACHQEVQEKVYNEIVTTFRDDTEFAPNKVKELSYLDAVIKETLRMFPPLAIVGRQLQNDIKVGEQTLPAGSNIALSIFLMHHNDELFPDSWKFDPNRFLDGPAFYPSAYIPFSAGPRNCIGQRFANIEIRVFIAHLLYNFRFSTDMNFLDNYPRMEISLVPTKGIPVRMEKRRS
ncbi:hypothetical protein M3Y98_00713400 [Aphelenchoides besseyi]|nr:hypothetical protein M3Y98_00713400 [Aphelenchoides besseyi]